MVDVEKPKTKRAPSAWAAAVQTHMKAGGKFPKKGSADYDAVKKIMGDKKPAAVAEPKAEPAPAPAPAPTPAPSPSPSPSLAVEKPKVVRKPREPKAKVEEPEKKVTEREVSVGHKISMARLGSGRPMMKLPFA